MGAHWLVGGKRRTGKATSSVVVILEKKLALGNHIELKGKWPPIEAYDFDRGRETEGRDQR